MRRNPTRKCEIMLQAFNWESHKSPSWWRALEDKTDEVSKSGFSHVWLPPATDSLAPQGYLPRDLYSLNTSYGSEEELRSLLSLLRGVEVEAVLDVVINHRVGSAKGEGGRWNRYDGMRMEWDEYAVTRESGGKGEEGTGEVFEGTPNIDHSREEVRRDLSLWLHWMREDVGFQAFRFDYAKGYSPQYVREYILSSLPSMAVGEYWDACNYSGPQYDFDYDQNSHRERIIEWIDGTGGKALAFDFTTKGILQEAVKRGEWWRLRDVTGRPSGLIGRRAGASVTFLENHDTGSTQAHWPFPKDKVLQGYAYLLTHPGIPTVFYDHFYDWGDDFRNPILKLMETRKEAGIHSESEVEIWQADENVYAAICGERVVVKLGDGDWSPEEDKFELKTSGEGYAVWIRKD